MQDDPDILAKRIELLELDLKKRDAEAAAKGPASKAWWVSAIEFLGLPTAVIAIALSLIQASGNVQTNAKTEAETAKIRVEEMKTRLELEKMVDDLAGTKTKGVSAYREEVEKTIPRLQETIERLKAIESATRMAPLERSLAKFVILWILFQAVDLVFSVVGQAWGTSLMSLWMFFINRNSKQSNGVEEGKPLPKYAQMLVAYIGAVPSILKWGIQLSIFGALIMPLFDEVALGLGSKTHFSDVIHEARRLDFAKVLSMIKGVMFGTPQ